MLNSRDRGGLSLLTDMFFKSIENKPKKKEPFKYTVHFVSFYYLRRGAYIEIPKSVKALEQYDVPLSVRKFFSYAKLKLCSP